MTILDLCQRIEYSFFILIVKFNINANQFFQIDKD